MRRSRKLNEAYRGYRYEFSQDSAEPDEPEKIWHYLVTPDGKRVTLDHSPYEEMSRREFEQHVKDFEQTGVSEDKPYATMDNGPEDYLYKKGKKQKLVGSKDNETSEEEITEMDKELQNILRLAGIKTPVNENIDGYVEKPAHALTTKTYRFGTTTVRVNPRNKTSTVYHGGNMGTRIADVAENVDKLFGPGTFEQLQAASVSEDGSPDYMYILKSKYVPSDAVSEDQAGGEFCRKCGVWRDQCGCDDSSSDYDDDYVSEDTNDDENQDGEDSPFTYGDENVDMVREEDDDTYALVQALEDAIMDEVLNVESGAESDDEAFAMWLDDDTVGKESDEAFDRLVQSVGNPKAQKILNKLLTKLEARFESGLEENDEIEWPEEVKVDRIEMDDWEDSVEDEDDNWSPMASEEEMERRKATRHDKYNTAMRRRDGLPRREDLGEDEFVEDFLIPPKDAKYNDVEEDDDDLYGDETKLGSYDRDMSDSEPFGDDYVDESASRKDFRMVANLIAKIEDPEERRSVADHHARMFALQNPRFDRDKFLAAAGVDSLDEIAPVIGAVAGAAARGVAGAVASASDQGLDEEGPDDTDDVDYDDDHMVDIGDEEVYDFDSEFEREMGNMNMYEMNRLRELAGLDAVEEDFDDTTDEVEEDGRPGFQYKHDPDDSTNDFDAFDFNSEAAYYLVADKYGAEMHFGQNDEILIPEKLTDKVIALLYDHGYDDEDYTVSTEPGIEEDLQNGYGDHHRIKGSDLFPQGATSTPATDLGPTSGNHSDNPMAGKMRAKHVKDSLGEDAIYEAYKKAYRRFRRTDS